MSDRRPGTGVVSAHGALAEFSAWGVLSFADVHLAQTLGRLHGEADPEVLLAVALTSRGVRSGSVCIDLTVVGREVTDEVLDPALLEDTDPDVVEALGQLAWPDPTSWLATMEASALVAGPDAPVNSRPLRLERGLLFLERHWASEQRIRGHLLRRLAAPPPVVDQGHLHATLASLFDGHGLDPGEDDLQARAVDVSARTWTSVIAGGPGTGKTTTVARLLAALNRDRARPLNVALAAPSGKAAARLHSSVLQEWTSPALRQWPMPTLSPGLTVHRLLGARGRYGGFRKGPDDPLAHDVVVLDEVSMLDLAIFERVLSALSPRTRLVMVGDPHQLSSVDAGRVLADVTSLGLTVSSADPTPAVVQLTRNFRFSGAIQDLAHAIRSGDADLATELLAEPPDDSIALHDVPVARDAIGVVPGLLEDVLGVGVAMVEAAVAGDAARALTALDRHRILCAHREGPYGVGRFTREVTDLLRTRMPGQGIGSESHVGRPVLATSNQADIGVFNGDTGVLVATEQGIRLAMGQPDQPRLLQASLVEGLQTLYAMTVHKSQGSQFDRVTVVLPPIGSPLLTRELLYTAVTRAQRGVRLVGGPEQVRAAIARPTQRLTGLGLTGLGLTALG